MGFQYKEKILNIIFATLRALVTMHIKIWDTIMQIDRKVILRIRELLTPRTNNKSFLLVPACQHSHDLPHKQQELRRGWCMKSYSNKFTYLCII